MRIVPRLAIAGAVVGQLGKLRPIGNRPTASFQETAAVVNLARF